MLMVMFMKGIGKMIKHMVKDFILIQMEVNMKENGKKISSMERE